MKAIRRLKQLTVGVAAALVVAAAVALGTPGGIGGTHSEATTAQAMLVLDAQDSSGSTVSQAMFMLDAPDGTGASGNGAIDTQAMFMLGGDGGNGSTSVGATSMQRRARQS